MREGTGIEFEGWRRRARENNAKSEQERKKTTAKLKSFYATKPPGHIISIKEACEVLGFPDPKQLKNLLQRAYGGPSLSEALAGIGLPHKPIKY
jgi:hypothetical protein